MLLRRLLAQTPSRVRAFRDPTDAATVLRRQRRRLFSFTVDDRRRIKQNETLEAVGCISRDAPRWGSPPYKTMMLRSLSTSSSNRSTSFATAIKTSTSGTEKSDEKKEMSRPGSGSGDVIRAYLDLSKAKLSSLVVATTAAGFCAAGPVAVTDLPILGACLTGTFLCSASAGAWNQILELDRDTYMKRTQHRPLVTGSLTVREAGTAAVVAGASGIAVLAAGTDPVTAALGAGNLFLYSAVYTPMKPHSIYNTWVGAVVGAVPPVMGWTAATGGTAPLTAEPVLLAAALYLWQMPHFFALSFMHRTDYRRGGFQMVPTVEEDTAASAADSSAATASHYDRTASLIVRYAWYLSAVPVVATVVGATSSMFACEGVVLNAVALKKAYDFNRNRTNANARQVFLTSLWYLPCFLMLFLLHSKVWDTNDEETDEAKDDVMAKFLQGTVHAIRERGREMCLHEAAVSKTVRGERACPVVLGEKQSQKGVQVVQDTAANVSEAAKEATVPGTETAS